MNTDIDEKIALEALPPAIDPAVISRKRMAVHVDKCISDDFPKQIDQREEHIPDD